METKSDYSPKDDELKNINSFIKKSMNGYHKKLEQDGKVYLKQGKNEDQLGDYRIIYNYVACGEITIIGGLQDNIIKKFNAL